MPYQVTIALHNFQNYDAHFITKVLHIHDAEEEVHILPATEEKYICLIKALVLPKDFPCASKRRAVYANFIDTYKFQSASLEQLAKNLPKEQKHQIRKYFNNDENKVDLICQKGVFPYSYLDTIEKLQDTQLLPISKFFNNLNEYDISEELYQH